MTPFPPELRTASIIPRWSVVWTLNRDTVANHSYFVAFYSFQIANLIGWQGNLAELMYAALVHDLDETISGDIVSPVKKAIVDPLKSRAYVRDKMKERMATVVSTVDDMCQSPYYGEIELIIKAADRLDAVLFLIVEERMGNRHVFDRCQDAISQLEAAWFALPFTIDDKNNLYHEHTWKEDVLTTLDAHRKNGGSGV